MNNTQTGDTLQANDTSSGSDSMTASKMENNEQDPQGASRKYWVFLIFIAIIGAFSSLVNDMYLPTIPDMMRQFHTTPSMTQMGISMAMAGMGVGSLAWGSLSDRYGRKPILVITLVIFIISTAISLFSRSIGFFVFWRFFQGIGAGGAMVLSTSIPADVYMGRRLAKLMAMVGAINGVAPALGPIVGGFMANSVGWKGIFLLLLAIGVGMLVWTSHYKETLPQSRRIAASNIKLFALKYKQLLTYKRFMLYVIIKAVAIGLLYAYISSAPFIMQDHYGFSSIDFGLIFGGNALAMAIGSTLALRFKVIKQGMVVGCIGMFVFATLDAIVMWHGGRFIWYELFAVPMLLCSGMIFSSANTLSMEVARNEAGTASAILSVVKYVFAAIVSPLVGLGNIMHSTSIMFVVVTSIALILSWFGYLLKPLADMERH